MSRVTARAAILAASLVAASSSVAAQSPAPVAGDFQVNNLSAGSQFTTDGGSVAVDADGDFVVVWTSPNDGDGEGVALRRYTSAGVAIGLEIRVNSHTVSDQDGGAVAMDDDGDFVVVWTSSGQDGDLNGVFARLFSSSGAAVGVEFQVNIVTVTAQSEPAVSRDADGDFVVAWSSRHVNPPNLDVFARRFSASGIALGGEIPVNTFTLDAQFTPAVDLEPDGDFVVAWRSSNQDGSSVGIFGQRFDSTGARQGGEFQANTYTIGAQSLPDVAVDSSGDFVVAWSGEGPGDASAVFVRRFDSSGTGQGPERRVSSQLPATDERPAIEADSDGDFVVAWERVLPPSSDVLLYARHFRRSGVATTALDLRLGVGSPLNTDAAIGVEPNGDFLIAWSAQPAASRDIFAQRFDFPSSLDLDGNGEITPLTDGLLFLRILSGFTDSMLSTGAVGPGCVRCDGAAILQHVNSEGGAVNVTPIRQGSEFRVNTFTLLDQLTSTGSVAVESGGDFVVVWQSEHQESFLEMGVFGQRFDSVGTRIGTEFQVNVQTVGNQSDPAVASDADGDFVVVWGSPDGSDSGISGRRFASSGAPVAMEFQVNANSAGDQLLPSVGSDEAGAFVVTWQTFDIFARRFDSGGAPQGTELTVTGPFASQGDPHVGVDPSGNFVIVWRDEDPFQPGFHYAFGRRFNSAGSAVGLQFSTGAPKHEIEPVVGVASDGRFVMASQVLGQVFARRFDTSGAELGEVFNPAGDRVGSESQPAVAVDADGDFVVAWNRFEPSDGYRVFARHFRASGVPTGDAIPMDAIGASVEAVPAVGIDSDGDFVVAWRGFLDATQKNDVFAQRFDVPALFDVDGDGQLTALTDGLLVERFLFGFTGPELTAGAVGADCTRCDSEAILAYLQGLL